MELSLTTFLKKKHNYAHARAPKLVLTRDKEQLDLNKCIAYITSDQCTGNYQVTFNQLRQIANDLDFLENEYFPAMLKEAKESLLKSSTANDATKQALIS